MKHFLIASLAVLLFSACKTQPVAEETTETKSELPYTLSRPYSDWQIGSQENVATVMGMIKAWESKDLAQCATFFADSVEFSFDGYKAVMAHDSIAGFLEESWSGMANVQVEMQDYESVISKDQKTEWVTLWYKQIMTDDKGKKDSLSLINDAKIEKGKIAIFSEYVQHYPSGK